MGKLFAKLLFWLKEQTGYHHPRPRKGEIWLMIITENERGSYLGSDYAESFVPKGLFRKISATHAIMDREGAYSYGLEDGWS